MRHLSVWQNVFRKMYHKSFHKNTQKIMLLIICVLVSCLFNFSQAGSFGRLFTTAEQRTMLDDLRRHQKKIKNKSKIISTILDKNISLDGVVVYDNGKNVVWVNGKNNLNPDGSDVGVSVANQDINSDSVTITLFGSNNRITLPGQTVDRVTGNVFDSYKAEQR